MSDCLLLDNVVGILELEVVQMGRASQMRKLCRDYRKSGLERGEKGQRRFPLEEAMEEADLGYEEDEDECEEATGIYAEMKQKGMTLDEFRERFSEELEVIKVGQIEVASGGVDIKTPRYEGLGLIIRHQLEKDFEMFPFPDAEDPKARVPSEVFDYLSSLSSTFL